MNEIQNKLKELRKINNFTQKDISKLIGISSTGYASWEQGLSEPNLECLVKLCMIYKVSLDYLVGLENEDFTSTVTSSSDITADEVSILDLYRSLNSDGREIARHYLENLQEINSIQKSKIG